MNSGSAPKGFDPVPIPPKKKWKKPPLNGSADRASPPAPPTEQDLYQLALRALTRRDHSASELRGKLLKAAGNPPQIEILLQKLREKGYLDDRKFAVHYIRNRISQKALGRTRLIMELRARGIADSLAEPLLDEFFPAQSEVQLLEIALQKKLRTLPPGQVDGEDAVLDAKILSKLYNYLFRMGFAPEAIRRSLARRFRGTPDFAE
jgi:regulatory protein